MNLSEHLASLGIRHFEDESYWEWAGKQLSNGIGESGIRKIDKLRKPIMSDRSTPAQRLAFYDFAAQPSVASVVHSLKADAIRASGEAVMQSLPQASDILDFGCNTGHLTTWYALQRPDANIVGIDISSISIQTARRYAKKIGVTNVKFVVGDPRKELASTKFDAIIDTQSVMEVVDRKAIQSWMAKAISRSGVFIGIPQTPLREDFIGYFHDIQDSGLHVIKIDRVIFNDLGDVGGYGLFVASHNKPADKIDPAACFDALLEQCRRHGRKA